MKFYIYSQPIISVRGQKVTGLLIKVLKDTDQTLEEKNIRKLTVSYSEATYDRLIKMLEYAGDSGDQWYVLDAKRNESHLLERMNIWEKALWNSLSVCA